MADPVQTIADTVRVRARRGELADGPEAEIGAVRRAARSLARSAGLSAGLRV